MLVLFVVLVVFFPPVEIKSAVTFVRVLSDCFFATERFQGEEEKLNWGSVICLQQTTQAGVGASVLSQFCMHRVVSKRQERSRTELHCMAIGTLLSKKSLPISDFGVMWESRTSVTKSFICVLNL